jgi:tripartite-type tricarboxylate transporter receptor subunit TctC
MKKHMIAGLLSCAAVLASPAWAQADKYPSQPVRFIVPLGPGSSADTNTRLLADAFSKLSGTTAIVENRPGADLSVGTAVAMSEPPDGHTILLISPSTMVLNPLLMKDLPYKTDDIRPVLNLMNVVGILVTSVDSPFDSLQDVLDEARKAPHSVSVGVYGNSYRLGTNVLAKAAGVQFNDIPYKGFGPTITDVIGGTTQTAMVDLGGALPLIRAGKIKALAVGSKERLPFAPDIPTISESGFPDYSLYIFVGYAVHSKTPEPLVQKIESLLQGAFHDESFQATLKQQEGPLFVGDAGKPFADFIANEVVKARDVMPTTK